MKYIVAIAMMFLLVACGYEEGDKNTNVEVYGTYVGDGAYYIQQNGDGDILSCTVADSNVSCSYEEFLEVQEIIEEEDAEEK